jgi:hypothetical protein
MNAEKIKEYEDYIETLYEEIERVKLIDTVSQEEIQRDIDSINQMILQLKNILSQKD